MLTCRIRILTTWLLVAGCAAAVAQITEKPPVDPGSSLDKSMARRDRKSFFMNGNRISTDVTNYGGVGPGYDAIRGVNNGIWHNLDYIFQFCPIIGASVPAAADSTKKLHIISDGLWDYPYTGLRDVSPTGDTLWQWEPLPGYADPEQSKVASNPAPDANRDGKPDSWPRAWYNPTLGKYVWPGYLQQDAMSADLEVFWAMDDRDNSEFLYFPFPDEPNRRGIGLQIDGRGFQWSNPLAENTIFFVYSVTNVSAKNLDTLFFGVYGDADLGGGTPENKDDNAFFIPPYDDEGIAEKFPVYSRSIVYFWDPDMTGARGLPLGYMGCKFLESPGNPINGIDDDGDGIIDERQDDGIDNDKDWSAITDDLGIDGIADTEDAGEGDGMPTAGLKLPDGSLDPLHPGEMNFELTDLDESDQIGLTSFNSWTWNQDQISNDESMWFRSIPRNFGAIQNNQDIVFIFGSGYINLVRGETKRISMALLYGENLDDLVTTAKTVQTIYNNNYRFFKPPLAPQLTAVPDDRKVTLYWDTKAEESVDPINGRDFEGYVIYRSTDPSFADVQTVTDGRGSAFLSEPLRDVSGHECRWDVAVRDEPFTDLNGNGVYDAGEPYVDATNDGRWTAGYEDIWKGYHPVPYEDRGVQYYLGNNSGLVHSFVDSNNVINGQTYYYAVVSYDHGDSIGIPPTECTKKIQVDPITSEYTFDINTAQVIPGPRVSGYRRPSTGGGTLTHAAGMSTAQVTFHLLNDLSLRDGGKYTVTIADSFHYLNKKIAGKSYTVLDENPYTETVAFYDTNFSTLGRSMLVDDALLAVRDAGGALYTRDRDYVINLARGTIRRTGSSRIPARGTALVTYRYTPVLESRSLGGEDQNPAFDGVRLTVADESALAFSPRRSSWVQGKTNFLFTGKTPGAGSRKLPLPVDLEVRWSSTPIDSALATPVGPLIRIPVKYSVWDVTSGIPVRCWTFLNQTTMATRNYQWDPGEEIVAFKKGSKGATTDTVTWGIVITPPADTIATPPVPPTDGDVLFFGTARPLSTADTYTLNTKVGTVEAGRNASVLGNIYVVPNPYVGFNEIEPQNRLPEESRGERRLYFENLPERCTIRIFTLNGDLVQRLEHDGGMANGREFWNLLNRDGFSVAYGIYIAHIEAPGIGETMIKFAIIK
jgi:hypothetical protein